jgi:hypothetical protein
MTSLAARSQFTLWLSRNMDGASIIPVLLRANKYDNYLYDKKHAGHEYGSVDILLHITTEIRLYKFIIKIFNKTVRRCFCEQGNTEYGVEDYF